MKTVENPATKPKLPANTRRRINGSLPPSCICSTERPETRERYAGISGITQGEKTESRPAANAVPSEAMDVASAIRAHPGGRSGSRPRNKPRARPHLPPRRRGCPPRPRVPMGQARWLGRGVVLGRLRAVACRRSRGRRLLAPDELKGPLAPQVVGCDHVVAEGRIHEDRPRHLGVASGQPPGQTAHDGAQDRVTDLRG